MAAARNSADEATRTVSVVASTGAPVLRNGPSPDGKAGYGSRWVENLDVRHADLSRLIGGPVLLAHRAEDPSALIGSVESVSRQSGALVAKLRFGRSPLATEILNDIVDGVRSAVSLGYVVSAWTYDGLVDGVRSYTATGWQPLELSVVNLGADPQAKVRNHDGDNNANQLMTRSLEMTLQNTHDSETRAAAVQNDDGAFTRAAVEADRLRVRGVQAAARDLNLGHDHASRQEIEALIDNGTPLAEAKRAMIDYAAARSQATSTRPRVETPLGGMGSSSARDAIARGLAHRMLPSIQLDAESAPYSRMSLTDLERSYNGAGYMSRGGGFGMQTQSDMAYLVGDATKMVLAKAYEVVQPPLMPAARLVQVRDFQAVNVIRPTVGPSLIEVGEHAEVKFGPVESGYEVVQAKTFARDFAFTRQLVVGDAVGALADFATMSARAASQTLGTLLTAALTANPVMSDGVAFFHASHGNLATSGTILSLAALEAAMIAVRSQTDDGGNVIGVVPKWLVVGPRREVQAKQLLAQIAAVEATHHNPYSGDLQVIVDPRLTGYEWFVLGDTNINPALAFVVLDGTRRWSTLNGAPVVEVDEHPNALGLRVRIYADFNAQPLDWRSAYRNAGSAS